MTTFRSLKMDQVAGQALAAVRRIEDEVPRAGGGLRAEAAGLSIVADPA